MRSTLWCVLLASTGWLALMSPETAQAQDGVVIYRCTDASGALTVQNDIPCPKGSKQERRVIQSVQTAPTPPAYVPPPVPSAAPAPSPAAPPVPEPAVQPAAPSEPVIADSDRLPPPALFECNTYDNDRYLSDDGNPPQRCVRMTTTGLGGLSSGGAGEACEMKTDQCQRVADGALCDGWRERLRTAESTVRFGTSENRDAAQAEVERIGRIVRESTCGM
ncbi:MAG TPA: DUF4124 domain-containing protein [Lysobacter sp.]